jgi:hypothetical protein
MRRLLFSLLLLGLAACSRNDRTPVAVSPSSTSEEIPPITTASIPSPDGEKGSDGHDEQDFVFDVDEATRAVEQVTTALENRDWDTLFTFISSSHSDHLTAERLAASMEGQEEQYGEIVAVEILSVPELLPDTSDHVMFIVDIAITFQKGEETVVNHYIDYYVLEEGEWMVEKSVPNLEEWQ